MDAITKEDLHSIGEDRVHGSLPKESRDPAHAGRRTRNRATVGHLIDEIVPVPRRTSDRTNGNGITELEEMLRIGRALEMERTRHPKRDDGWEKGSDEPERRSRELRMGECSESTVDIKQNQGRRKADNEYQIPGNRICILRSG